MKLLQLYSQLAKALISCPPAGGVAMNETVVRDITSLNSKFFHIDLCRMQELQRSPSQESDIVDLVYESGTTEFSSSWSGINVYHLCNFLELIVHSLLASLQSVFTLLRGQSNNSWQPDS
ncbi:hypothetical protein NC653_012104 [Populus alba x Populus x berolinensis]|uniref:Uncharacterized protein n=1 Tax=Populus alba x Populus x berolinensis TaxID=444605 RepID=A0AAD6R3Y5_9ROSI|nr:hypothetical protein NC653_012104 [Populus alba x Populus x berolinensis]